MKLSSDDAVSIRQNESYIRVILFSVINGSFLFPGLNIQQILNKLVEYHLLFNGFIKYYHDHKTILDLTIAPFESSYEQYSIDDVSGAYSNMLSIEMHSQSKSTLYEKQKDRRDAAGAYYTPNKLSTTMVVHALEQIDTYLMDGIKTQQITIIDPSCGCGEFLVSTKKELSFGYGITDEVASKLLYGVDTDPIAIQITVVRIFNNQNLPEPDFISNHYFVGNALYPGNNTLGADLAELYVNGRIYSQEYGVLDKISNKKYDLIIGNPPWEKIRFEDRKFFRQYSSPIADITKKNQRLSKIKSLRNDQPALYDLYVDCKKDYDTFKKYATSGSFFTKSINGELNTYALFTELCLRLCSKPGITALILKSAIMTSTVNRKLFTWLRKEMRLSEVYFFNNSRKIFDIDSREQFCIAFFYNHDSDFLKVSFGNTDVKAIADYPTLRLHEKSIELINPETLLLPGLNSNAEFSFLERIYSNNSTFASVFPNCHFGRLVHLTLLADKIFTESSETTLPILEGKMIGQYTSNYSTFSTVDIDKRYLHKSKSNPSSSIEDKTTQCRYHIDVNAWMQISKNYSEQFSLVWRDLTSSTNSRTMIATIVPHMPSSQSVQLLQCEDNTDLLLILSIFNSKVFDYILRSKLSGIDLTQTIIVQMPVPNREQFQTVVDFDNKTDTIQNHLIGRVVSLLPSLDFKLDCPSFKSKRDELIEDIDRLIAISYGISEEEFDAILQSF